ncbi:(d)CMP kinase [Sediminitomix flava]|uniref:Cytidylate kinase n=1 Tax=Sediminitomix flava TaxID=379075 RepID=A0A315ZBJ2_SEDFL|nr:(d)CMP kinase [Sediminitomix flava]PWJ42084.1 cytidylate kinase [Sediminitomix flava]
MKKIIVALDGHAGCGKSSTAKIVSKELGYVYIDTGAMYRAVTFHFLENKINLENLDDVESELAKITVGFDKNPETGAIEVTLNGERVEAHIRTMEVTNNVSNVSAIKSVRTFLVAEQQKMGIEKGIVMDGRDIGTVVFPTAELKVFMTADVEERARRRQIEMESKGLTASFEEIVENLKERDHIDSTREESPLRKADDALVLDTTNLKFDDQVKQIVDWANALIKNN